MKLPEFPFQIVVKKEVVVFDKRYHQPCEWWEIRRRRWPNLLREQIFACHIDHDKVHTIKNMTPP